MIFLLEKFYVAVCVYAKRLWMSEESTMVAMGSDLVGIKFSVF